MSKTECSIFRSFKMSYFFQTLYAPEYPYLTTTHLSSMTAIFFFFLLSIINGEINMSLSVEIVDTNIDISNT